MIGNLIQQTAIQKNYLIRAGVVIALFVVCVILGSRTPALQLDSATSAVMVGGIVLAIFVIVALRHIEWGVFAIIATAFFVRFTLPTGTQSRIPASLVLTPIMLVLWFVWMALRRRIHFVPSRVNLPLFAFMVVSILSLPWSWLAWRPELFSEGYTLARFQVTQIGGLAVMVLLPAALFLGLNALQDVKWYKWLLVIMVAIAAPELIQRVSGRSLEIAGLGISGPGLYHLWLISLLYAQVLFNRQLSFAVRAFFIALIVGWFFYLFVLDLKWFSGWMTATVAILFLSFQKSKKVTLVLLLAMLIPFLLAADYYYTNIWVKAQTDDWNRFTFLWPTIIFDLTLTKAGLLFGAGPAGYALYFVAYYPGQAMSAHNNYVDIIAETGIVGTFFFLWFLWAVFRTGWQQQKIIKDDFLLAFNNGVLAGFVGMILAMMLDDWFIPFAYNNGLPGFDMNVYAFILVGAMLGLGRLVQRTQATQVVATPSQNPPARIEV